MSRAIRPIVFLGLCFGWMLQAESIFAQTRVAQASPPADDVMTSSSLEFTPNRGQIADQFGKPMPEVLYTLDGHGVKFYFTKNSMHYVFAKSVAHALACAKDWDKLKSMSDHDLQHDTLSLYRVDAHFLGANPNVTITAEDPASNYTNYYLPQCPNGITHVPAFYKIVYHNLYPHIDMVVYSDNVDPTNPNNSKNPSSDNYDFIVHPGGNPNQIRVEYEGQDSLVLNAVGRAGSADLRIVSPFGGVTELAPSSYQGERRVASHYILRSNILSYSIDAYNHSRDLTIDPPRLWGTYFGWADTANLTDVQGLAVDRSGNVNIFGSAYALADIATTCSFETTYGGGNSDCYIASFGPVGNLRWATYYGGSGDDYGRAIACDNVNGMVITGYTTSTNVIATAGSFQPTFGPGTMDAFLASFDSTGARRWGTYIRGVGMSRWLEGLNGQIVPPNPGTSYGTGVALDSSQNIIVAGFTSDSGIATAGAHKFLNDSLDFDAFLVKFTSGGAESWATYFGGNSIYRATPPDSLAFEGPAHVATDANNNIYMAGTTTSLLPISTSGAFQTTPGPVYFSKWSSAGVLDWASYYLDSVESVISNVAVSPAGVIYLAAYGLDPGIATPGAYQQSHAGGYDGILAKFSTAGKRIWATYYGGTGTDKLYDLVLDTSENIFASGHTESSSGIATAGEYQTTLLGPYNPFMIKFDSSGHRRWGTYYGRRGDALAIGLDREGHPFLGGFTNTGTDEYASSGAYDGTPYGVNTSFLAKFCDPAELRVAAFDTGLVCPGIPDTLTTKPGFLTYQWYSNGSSISGATSATYAFLTPLISGHYFYTVNAVGTDLCSTVSDTVSLVVQPVPQIVGPQIYAICPGSSVKLLENVNWNGRVTYSWTPTTGLDHPDSLQPIATPSKRTVYTLAVTDTNGCQGTKQVTVSFYTQPVLGIAGGNRSVCAGSSTPLAVSLTGGFGPFSYTWSPSADLDRSDSATVTATPKSSSTYFVTVTDGNGCNTKDSVVLTVTQPPTINLGPSLSTCRGSSIKIGATIKGGKSPYTIAWSPAVGLNDSTLAQPTASPTATTMYTVTVTDKNGCAALDSILVTVADSLSPTITADRPLTVCTGDTVTLDAGTGYATYAWSSGEKTSAIAVTKTGDYSVHVTNNSGCSGTSAALHVTVLPDSVPRPVLTASSTVICEGDSIQLGLIGKYSTYRWSTGDSSSSIFVSKSDSYSVTATNAAGCSGTSAPLAITVAPVPTAAIVAGGPVTFCSGDSVMLTATPGSGGTYTFKWNNGDSTPRIVVKKSGNYFATITNAAGCAASSAPLVVTVNPAPTPSISGPASVCPNSTTTYSVANNPGDSYTWTLVPAASGTIANSTSASTAIQWGAAGTATLFLTEITPEGCSAFTTLPISASSNLAPLVEGPSAVCAGDSITLDVPGSGYASYVWSRDGNPIAGAGNDSITIGQAGNYTVFVTSAGGCSGTSAPVNVTVYPLSAPPVITRIGTALRSTPAAHYQWSYGGSILTDSINQSITPDTDGLYSVTITDSNGCSSTSGPFNYSNAAWASVSLPENVIGAPGDTISIPLTLDSAHNLLEAGATKYTAIIGLDPTMLVPIRPAGVRVGTGWVVTLTGTTPTKPGVLQTITARVLDSGYCSDLTIDTFYFPGANVTVTEHSGSFCLNTPCTPVLISSDTAFTIKRISPNPGQGEFWIEYHVASEGPLTLELEDYLGRIVTVLKQEWSKPGDETETYSAQNISSGLYRLVLRSAARELSRLLVIAK